MPIWEFEGARCEEMVLRKLTVRPNPPEVLAVATLRARALRPARAGRRNEQDHVLCQGPETTSRQSVE